MPTMKCTEFEQKLRESVECRRPIDSDELRGHASRCDRCRIVWEQAKCLERIIPLWQARTVEVDLVDAVLTQVALGDRRHETSRAATSASTVVSQIPGERIPAIDSESSAVQRRTPRNARRDGWAVLTAVAVVLLLMIRPLLQSDSTQPEMPAAGTQFVELDNAPRPNEPIAGDVDAFVEDASSAYLTLALNAAEAVTDMTTFVSPVEPPSMTIEFDAAAPTWIDRWGDNLKPIGHDVGKAVEFLFKALPVDSGPTT